MKFYNREVELKTLDEIQKKSLSTEQLTAVMGRLNITSE